jgi:Cu2+-exporting ATPase
VLNTFRGSGEVYFDSVAMFIFFLLLGRYAEMRGRHQASNVTDALAQALPADVQRIDPATGAALRTPLAAVRLGDRLRVGSGQVIPVDGSVLEGTALVDESLLTGESAPHRRAVGDLVLGGSINAGATLNMIVTRAADQSTLHGLVRLLERAQAERPRLGLAAERMASWFIVRVLILTALVGIIWYVIDPSRAFPAVLAVLVATCPCALSIATPVAIAAATSRLSRLGILVMRSDAIEGLATLDTVMLDKTGTLTIGQPTVTRIETSGGLSREQALAIAAALEVHSQHPIAAAFRPYRTTTVICTDARDIPGVGIEGSIDGVNWRIGQPSITLSDGHSRLARFEVADELRPEAPATVQALRDLGLQVQLASGDSLAAVERTARALGIEQAAASLKPEDKLARLRSGQALGHRVLMLGDGINDGPVLAAADVSMAMGRGSSIAHAAGDLLLLRESLGSLPKGIAVARDALRIVRQNLRWSAAYNLAAIPIAAIGLMPPWVAALGMSLSSLAVVLNAQRLLRNTREAR